MNRADRNEYLEIPKQKYSTQHLYALIGHKFSLLFTFLYGVFTDEVSITQFSITTKCISTPRACLNAEVKHCVSKYGPLYIDIELKS